MNQKGFVLITAILFISVVSLMLIYLYVSQSYDQEFLKALIEKRALK
jgi:hypothetical protein